MTPQRTKPRPQPSFARLSNATLLAIIEELDGDGHGIFKLSFLINKGVPDDLVLSAVGHYESDPESHVGTIYAPGAAGMPGDPALESLDGIYSLDLYYRLCNDLGLPTGSMFMGRGRIARQLHERIKAHLATRPEPEASSAVPS
jgi:hypothetical protein